jgi:hypothetical protein
MEFSIIARVRVDSRRSRPRSSVTLATTATRMAGAAARLQDQPKLTADDGAEQQDDQQIDREQCNDHFMRRGKRRQIGKDDEGDERAEQRNDDREPAQGTVFNPGG